VTGDVTTTVSAIVVSFSDPEATRRAVDSLLAQSHPPTEVLVADNHPDARTADAMRAWQPDARVRLVHSGKNLGYTGGCNVAAAQARGEWLLFLNPDARADPSCLATLIDAVDSRCGVAGAQVLLPDSRTNAGDNPVHITGIAWSGRFGEPREYGPPREVGSVSGAALLARAQAFREAGGMCERLFMYEDDVDLCWRVRLTGWTVMFCPDAVVWHEYEFDKGTMKWFWLERNRLWTVLSNYSALTLVLLAPLLLGTELMVATQAIRGGWTHRLLRAWGSVTLGLPDLIRWRRGVQRGRQVGDREIMERMSGRVQTSLLESPLTLRVNPLLAAYRRIVLAVLEVAGR
jgi:GT2 family glycosyltransferase